MCDWRETWRHTGKYIFEIRDIHWRAKGRDIRNWNGFGVHLNPVDGIEVNVTLDQWTRKPSCRVPFQKTADQTLQIVGHELREQQGVLQNSFVHQRLVLCPEGRHAAEHLVQQSPEAPPVHFKAVLLVQKNLRRQVLCGPGKRLGTVFGWSDHLT